VKEINKEINKDVIAINNSVQYLVNVSESIGYANGSISELVTERANATSEDDKSAYLSQIDRLYATMDVLKSDRSQAIENVKQAFEHYYS